MGKFSYSLISVKLTKENKPQRKFQINYSYMVLYMHTKYSLLFSSEPQINERLDQTDQALKSI